MALNPAKLRTISYLKGNEITSWD